MEDDAPPAATTAEGAPAFAKKPPVPIAVMRELYPVGSICRVRGLRSEPGLNGITGRVVGYKEQSGRVKLAVVGGGGKSGGRAIALKPGNLASLDE
eukprot:COSAG01_NODE_17303_length_1162_cov_0.953904_1_plen_96_part_00